MSVTGARAASARLPYACGRIAGIRDHAHRALGSPAIRWKCAQRPGAAGSLEIARSRMTAATLMWYCAYTGLTMRRWRRSDRRRGSTRGHCCTAPTGVGGYCHRMSGLARAGARARTGEPSAAVFWPASRLRRVSASSMRHRSACVGGSPSQSAIAHPARHRARSAVARGGRCARGNGLESELSVCALGHADGVRLAERSASRCPPRLSCSATLRSTRPLLRSYVAGD
jgi:hypothetical protein